MKKSPNPRLLAEEEFIAVQPSLIRAMNGKVLDAILLQYIFWYQRMKLNSYGEHNDWVYNSYEQWADKIGVSVQQIRTSMNRLEEAGIVTSCKPEAANFRQCKWYRVDLFHPMFSDLSESTNGSGVLNRPLVDSNKSSSYTERTQRASSSGAEDVTNATGDSASSLPAGTVETGDENNSEGSTAQGGNETDSPQRPGAPPTAEAGHATIGSNGTLPQANSTSRSPGSTSRWKASDEKNPEVVRLCHLLADLIQENDNTRPNPDQKQWYTACRLLMTKDGPEGKGYTPGQVEAVLRWSQNDEFWRCNILSMPKLRMKFDQLRSKRNEELRRSQGNGKPADQGRSIIEKYKARIETEKVGA